MMLAENELPLFESTAAATGWKSQSTLYTVLDWQHCTAHKSHVVWTKQFPQITEVNWRTRLGEKVSTNSWQGISRVAARVKDVRIP